MKLVIFTPAVSHSAIGRMAKLLVDELVNQGHQVTVIRTEETSLFKKPVHPFNAKLVSWNDRKQVKKLTYEADACVYQIGNNYQFHCGALEWLSKLSGIVCLHDYFLGNLFHGWSLQNHEAAKHILRIWYGQTISENFFSSNLLALHDTAPMTEWLTAMASGVITHSSWNIKRVLNACPGPVYSVGLPYNKLTPPNQDKTETKEVSRTDSSFTILTVGHINPNKRVESVIQAIGRSTLLSKQITYRLIGKIEDSEKQKLSDLAKSLNVNLSILGEVDDAHLHQEISQADIVCCLRFPALEAASASTIEAMLNGKPVIVLNTGFYQEIPDHLVCKVSLKQEISDLQKQLEFLYKNKDIRLKMGKEAEKWALTVSDCKHYVKSLIDICSSAAKAAPIIQTGAYFSKILASWDDTELCQSSDILKPLSLFELLSCPGKEQQV